MALAIIRKEFLSKRVAFGKSAARLRDRTDIDDLAIIALESQNENLLRLFETPMPDLQLLKKNRIDGQLKNLVAAIVKNNKWNAGK
jgi:hypothetical protein